MMLHKVPVPEPIIQRSWGQFLPDLRLGLQNLASHKLRTLLTMLGIIFGVAAVVSMLSIGAGAQHQVMAFIEQLGVRNLIVEAREAHNWQELQKVRKLSQGLSFQDLRVIRSSVNGIAEATARKRFIPTKLLPKPQRDTPTVYGVAASYQHISGLRLVTGRFFDSDENEMAAPVCVLGEGAKASLFGHQDAVGEYLKVNEQWYRVIGVAGPQISSQTDVAGIPMEDRTEDTMNWIKDEIDGLYLQLEPGNDSVSTADVVRGILNISHRNAGDFSVVVPAELLAEQQRTQRIFDIVMVAIASISLLVGGIGIMNIMLASILERTGEIGIRRAVGARQKDIIRQFLIEAILISFVGGLIGILLGFGISRLIAFLAGWSTIVTASSIILAFLVSVSVGLIFGIYPARKAALLDPVEAIRYE